MNRVFTTLLLPLVILGSYLAFAGPNPEPVTADPEAPEEWVMDDALAAYLDQFERDFEKGLAEKRIPGAAVAIVKDGHVVFQKGFGLKET